jgi:hypothetical protein
VWHSMCKMSRHPSVEAEDADHECSSPARLDENTLTRTFP